MTRHTDTDTDDLRLAEEQRSREDGHDKHPVGSTTGTGAGATIGAVAGMAVAGPPGAVVAGAVGGIIGGLTGHGAAAVVNPKGEHDEVLEDDRRDVRSERRDGEVIAAREERLDDDIIIETRVRRA